MSILDIVSNWLLHCLKKRYKLIIKRTTLIAILCFGIVQNAFSESLQVKVLNSKGQILPNMVVYLEPPEGMKLHTTNNLIEVAQIDKSFSPYIGVMQKGSSVKFNNKDNISHHIYSPIGVDKFAFKINAGEDYIKNDFLNAGSISMGCNIHDWMSGHLLVVETPYFNKTDKQGIAKINVEESGEYNVVVWHPQMREANHKISKKIVLNNDSSIEMKLVQPLDEFPSQKSEDDFDFLSDY